MEIELLQPERLDAWGKRLKFPAEAVAALQTTASLVRSEAELRSIFTAFYERTALRGEWHREWSPLPVDPRVQARLGEDTSQFYLLGYMAALPHTEVRYNQIGVSAAIFDDTMRDFLNYLMDYHDLHNRWGYAEFAWIWRHLTCELFRLGRLQYMLAPYRDGATAFRRKPTTRRLAGGASQAPDGGLPDVNVLLLADPNRALRADGYAYGAGQFPNQEVDLPPEAWKPVYEASEAGWRGHPVSPYGFALPQPVFLPRSEWEIILQPGDTVLDLHIPRKDPLTAETCGASFRMAIDFYRRFFPERPWKALFCHTWFFTVQLQTMLPPDSAIVQFQREFYLYPFPGSLGFLWSFVFGAKYPDPLKAPRDTSLRRAVLDWLDHGKEIFELSGVLFHAPEEWGTQPYMSSWDIDGK